MYSADLFVWNIHFSSFCQFVTCLRHFLHQRSFILRKRKIFKKRISGTMAEFCLHFAKLEFFVRGLFARCKVIFS